MKLPTRVPSQVSESLHKRLNAYALAASAAGLGVLAFAPPAEAKIVYTPANIDCSHGCDISFIQNDFVVTLDPVTLFRVAAG